MNTSVGKKGPASVLRAYTQQVRDHTFAMQRLQDQYFAALKRAEAQYFDGVKKITDAIAQETGADVVVTPPPSQAQAAPDFANG